MSFKIYLYQSLPGIELSILTKIFKAENLVEGKLFQSIPTEPFTHIVKLVSIPEEADMFLIPHNYFKVKDKEYLKSALDLAGKFNVPLLIFTLNDETTPINLPGSIVLRPSVYKSKMLQYERVIPALIEDVGAQFGFTPRQKESKIPSIGFSGMVELATWQLEMRYQLRLLFNRIQSFVGIISTAEYQGLYYRRRATSAIERSSLCVPHFNIRKTFSANIKTIEGNPEQMRKEFVDSIQNSDLSLVVRGNGNYSLRFFEVLSLGRIPLFIDTDLPLPLEDVIDYDTFMIRVSHKDIDKIPEIVDAFWKKVTPEEYVAMQVRAREVFETYLRPDSYFRRFFAELTQKN